MEAQEERTSEQGFSEDNVFYFDRLPPEIKRCIVGFLEFPDLLSASLACTELHELSKPGLHRMYCCKSCGHEVYHPRDVMTTTPLFELPDGRCLCAANVKGLRYGEEHNSLLPSLRRGVFDIFAVAEVMLPMFQIRAQYAHCRNCRRALGLRVNYFQSSDNIEIPEQLRAYDGVVHVCEDYVELRGPDTQVGVPVESCVCSGARSSNGNKQCGNALFSNNLVINTDHCWDSGDGIEEAYYVSTLREGSYELRNIRVETLAQGLMEVADVHCSKCSGCVGWKFCKDFSPFLNECQVERYGIVFSSVLNPEVQQEVPPTNDLLVY